MLLELSNCEAWCCGFASRRTDGAVVKTTRNFHLDHVDPKSKEGSNQNANRAPICPHHNIRRVDKRIRLADYRELVGISSEMLVNQTDDLIDLAWAQQQAFDIYADEKLRRANQPALTNR